MDCRFFGLFFKYMHTWEIQSFGLSGLRLAECPEPEPGPAQVSIRVRSVSLNYRDWLTVDGRYNPKQRLPLVPCSDGAGEVAAVGAGVTKWKPGDRVCGIFAQGWQSGEATRAQASTTLGGPLAGMLRELAVLHEDGVVAVPPHLSFEEAACLPCAAVTAWNAIVGQGRVKAGDTVVIQGTGGVSLFAMQFAKLQGARVMVTSSSDMKLARARSMGADHLWNYVQSPDWEKGVRELTGGVGADHIVEVGGADTLARSLKAIRMGGTISIIGQLTGNETRVSLIPILMRNVRLQGVIVGSRETFESMNRAITLHGLKPAIDSVIPFERAPEAFERMSRGAQFGKIVVAVGESTQRLGFNTVLF